MRNEILKGIVILDEGYNSPIPISITNTVCVFNFENGKKAFDYTNNLDYVIALKEETGEWVKCFSIKDLDEYYNF